MGHVSLIPLSFHVVTEKFDGDVGFVLEMCVHLVRGTKCVGVGKVKCANGDSLWG